VVIPGSGFRSLWAAKAVEAELGIPVVTANSAVLDHYLAVRAIPLTADPTA
jgi:hypothetical protein